MGLFLSILKVIGIILLVILALIILFLVLPLYYDIDFGTNNKTTYYNVKIKALLNIFQVEVMNDLVILKIFGFIKIKLSSNNKPKEEVLEEIEIREEDYVKDDLGFFKKLKLKTYILERKIKEKTYKFRKTVNDINEYTYKMELLKKTIRFIENIIEVVKPKESQMSVEIGCGNSEITGKLCGAVAILSARYPNLLVIPNFEKKTLSFEVLMNGNMLAVKALILFIKYSNEESVKKLRALRKEKQKCAKKKEKMQKKKYHKS